jgi:plasmid stabilization system protein ParE
MIVFSPDAVADVERLRSFLDQANPGAARRAMAAIQSAIERLQEFPELGMPTGDTDIRQLVVRFGHLRLYCALHDHAGDRGYFHHAHMARPRSAGLA